jgi:hypothetical protein
VIWERAFLSAAVCSLLTASCSAFTSSLLFFLPSSASGAGLRTQLAAQPLQDCCMQLYSGLPAARKGTRRPAGHSSSHMELQLIKAGGNIHLRLHATHCGGGTAKARESLARSNATLPMLMKASW